MRKSSPLDALLSKRLQAVMATLILQPEKSWYLSHLARQLNLTPSSLQQPLAALFQAGIVLKNKEGNRVYFQANTGCPFLTELQGLMAKTVGLVDILRHCLETFGRRIQVAFVFGSIAKSKEKSGSDIDLVVMGSVSLSELVPALRKAEERLNRQVNASVYSPGEFFKKLHAGHHFLKSILGTEKLFIIGGESDLKKAGIRKSPRTSSDE